MTVRKRDFLGGVSALIGLAAMPAAGQEKKKYIVQIPIDFDAFSRPIVGITIGDEGPFRFLIDTGAFGAAIKEDLAKRLKLPQSGVIKTGSIKGHESNYIYTARGLLMSGLFKIPHMDLVGEDKPMGAVSTASCRLRSSPPCRPSSITRAAWCAIISTALRWT